jgi:hypothetical protein
MRTPRRAVMKWCRGVLVFCVSLVLLTLATAVATSNRPDRNSGRPEAANLHSGGGNLIPVF